MNVDCTLFVNVLFFQIEFFLFYNNFKMTTISIFIIMKILKKILKFNNEINRQFKEEFEDYFFQKKWNKFIMKFFIAMKIEINCTKTKYCVFWKKKKRRKWLSYVNHCICWVLISWTKKIVSRLSHFKKVQRYLILKCELFNLWFCFFVDFFDIEIMLWKRHAMN